MKRRRSYDRHHREDYVRAILAHIDRCGQLGTATIAYGTVEGKEWSLGHSMALQWMLDRGTIKPVNHSGALGGYRLKRKSNRGRKYRTPAKADM